MEFIRRLKYLYLNFFLFFAVICIGQIKNSSSIYVGDNSVFYIPEGITFAFGSTTISKTGSSNGKFVFASTASWSGANESNFIEGYVETFANTTFVIPVGQSQIYAPIKVIPQNTSGVLAAYFRANPSSVGTSFHNDLTTVSSIEYWTLSGVNSTIFSLSWRSSSEVMNLTNNNLSNLTIAGWNGSLWVEIPSTVDETSFLGATSNISSGSITSNSSVDLTNFTVFTLANKGESCFTIPAPSGVTFTWDGTSWGSSANTPTLSDRVIINGVYNGNLLCNSLVLNGSINLGEGQTVQIVNGVTGNGKIIMTSEASVVQHNGYAQAPTIELTKVTNPMRLYDYVFLSSPITNGDNFFSHLSSSMNTAVNGNFGVQPNSAFSSYKSLNDVGAQVDVTTTVIGKGLRARVRNQAPYNVAFNINNKFPISIKTTGVANNGNISQTINSNTWAMLGNPYPSAIDGSKILSSNSNLRPAMYYWTCNTPMSSTGTYSINDWATWTEAGGVSACATCMEADGSIASMQSVYVKNISPVATTVTLTNCMRKTSGNDHFFKSSPNDKYWINLVGSSGSFSQILIAYNDESNVTEDAYDGVRLISGTGSYLSSLIGATKYVVQARSVFDASDIVPLAVTQSNSETFSIGLDRKQGIFNSNDIFIYLHDKDLNVYHDFANGNYSYIPNNANDTSRFELVYQQGTLSNPIYNANNVIAYIKQNNFYCTSPNLIKTIEVFDLTGRKIMDFSVNDKTIIKPFNFAQTLYIFKFKMEDDTVFSLKILNY